MCFVGFWTVFFFYSIQKLGEKIFLYSLSKTKTDCIDLNTILVHLVQ